MSIVNVIANTEGDSLPVEFWKGVSEKMKYSGEEYT